MLTILSHYEFSVSSIDAQEIKLFITVIKVIENFKNTTFA